MEGQRLQNGKLRGNVKGSQRDLSAGFRLLTSAALLASGHVKYLCSVPAQRLTLALLRSAHPPAATPSAAKNWVHSISHCHRTPTTTTTVGLSVCLAESQGGHPPCHLAP